MKKLEDYVISIPDFPKEGIIFRDVTGVLGSPEGFHTAVDAFQEKLEGVDFDLIAGIEARGFFFAAPIAYAMGKGVVAIRKKGKLPRETWEVDYDLEYGTAAIEMHRDAVSEGQKVVLVDDLLATGGSLGAAISLIEKAGGKVVKIITLIELKDLKGRENLRGYDYDSILSYSGE